MASTRIWKVYGADGHRQRESFNDSYSYDFSTVHGLRKINVMNADITGSNDYSIVMITRDTFEECENELLGQISDGIFENARVGAIDEVKLPESITCCGELYTKGYTHEKGGTYYVSTNVDNSTWLDVYPYGRVKSLNIFGDLSDYGWLDGCEAKKGDI